MLSAKLIVLWYLLVCFARALHLWKHIWSKIYHPCNKNIYKTIEEEHLFHRLWDLTWPVRLWSDLPFFLQSSGVVSGLVSLTSLLFLDSFLAHFPLDTIQPVLFCSAPVVTIAGPFYDYSSSVPWSMGFPFLLLSSFLQEILPTVVIIGFLIYSEFAHFIFSVQFFFSSALCHSAMWQIPLHRLKKEWHLLLVVWSSLVSVPFRLVGGGTSVLPPHAVVNSIQENTGLNQNCDRSSLHTHGIINNKGGSNHQWLKRGSAAKTYWVGTCGRLQSVCMKHRQRDYLLCSWMKP